MDSAKKEQLSEILRAQEARLTRQEQFQTAMASHLGQLTLQLQGMMDQLARPTAAAPSQAAAGTAATAAATPSPVTPIVGPCGKLAPPTQFTGEQGLCKTFIIDCSIHFELTPHAFPTDQSKIAFMISHLSGRTKAWASAEWARNS